MKFIRKYIVKVVMKEIALNGVTLGNKKISNKDGKLAITEVKDGK